MNLNRSSSGHHMSHLPLHEANIVVSQQRLQKEVRALYRLIAEGADEETIEGQKFCVQVCEKIIQRLQEAQISSTAS
jgi:hypothetical protein